VRELLVAAGERAGATEARAGSWAYRYLESSRLLVPAPAPLSPAEKTKLAGEQADLLVGVLFAVLDGLGLSDEDWEKGRSIAEKALQAVVEEGWSPL
jgi:hypothetical protein